jgi:hypothetical protein
MEALTPTHSVTSTLERGEIFFKVTGFHEVEDMEKLNADLDRHAWPMIQAGKKLHVMGDMEGFVPQSRETGDEIHRHLTRAKDYKLSRVAIFNASSLTKLQYKRISAGIEVGFFDNRTDALKWLRRPYDDAA